MKHARLLPSDRALAVLDAVVRRWEQNAADLWRRASALRRQLAAKKIATAADVSKKRKTRIVKLHVAPERAAARRSRAIVAVEAPTVMAEVEAPTARVETRCAEAIAAPLVELVPAPTPESAGTPPGSVEVHADQPATPATALPDAPVGLGDRILEAPPEGSGASPEASYRPE